MGRWADGRQKEREGRMRGERTMGGKRTLLAWSSGKDSAWALHLLRSDPTHEVVGLFTTVNERVCRASMHATSLEMLRLQALRAGLPLHTVSLPDPCAAGQYDGVMQRFVEGCRDSGVECMAFGDIFLEDVRAYREQRLKGSGIEPVFPLWGLSTSDLARTMIESGLQAYISCVDLEVLDAGYAGKPWTMDLVEALPKGCDPCGENGEYHTVVFSGPMFSRPIPARVGDIVIRDRFAYADVMI